MRLALESDPHIYLVRSYGEGAVIVNTERLTRALLISPARLEPHWEVESFEALCASTSLEALLQPLLSFGAAIVILGAGERQPIPSSPLRAAFRKRQIGLECMNLGAACRTYNVLASEQRSVVAGLFPADR